MDVGNEDGPMAAHPMRRWGRSRRARFGGFVKRSTQSVGAIHGQALLLAGGGPFARFGRQIGTASG
jgi:hypothetical protein